MIQTTTDNDNNRPNLRPAPKPGKNRGKLIAPAVVLFITLPLINACQQQKAAAPPPPPPAVEVVNVSQKDVSVTGDWVATLDGYVNAQIQPQVTGYLLKQNYHEGSLVHKNDILFEIDPRTFQAALDQANGQLAQAKGQLAQAEAQLALAEINVKRDAPLAKARAVAQSQMDNDTQTLATAKATVETDRAGIQTAQATVESAELNLGWTKVRSLIDGIAGTATVQIGNLVSQSTVLTSVSQVNPIKAYFPISEQEYLSVSDNIKPGAQGDWLSKGRMVPLQLRLADTSMYPYKGHIVFTERQVDSQTGTIRIVGAFPNPKNLLRPGQFGRVSAVTGVTRGALLVPQRCVSELQGKYQVAVVAAGNKVSIRNVEVGPRDGDMWVILKGVSLGDQVISEGLEKIRDGATVSPTPDKSPAVAQQGA